jgi:hypothetical protein
MPNKGVLTVGYKRDVPLDEGYYSTRHAEIIERSGDRLAWSGRRSASSPPRPTARHRRGRTYRLSAFTTVEC